MKTLITTYGSRGDIQPYVALGLGLMNRGHQVILATIERFKGFVLQHGLEYRPMDDGLLGIIDTDLGKEMVETTINFFSVIKQNIRLAKQL